jgi:hypothetical protein
MGCGDECPYVPGLRRDDWPLRDPRGEPLEEVRRVREEFAIAWPPLSTRMAGVAILPHNARKKFTQR